VLDGDATRTGFGSLVYLLDEKPVRPPLAILGQRDMAEGSWVGREQSSDLESLDVIDR